MHDDGENSDEMTFNFQSIFPHTNTRKHPHSGISHNENGVRKMPIIQLVEQTSVQFSKAFSFILMQDLNARLTDKLLSFHNCRGLGIDGFVGTLHELLIDPGRMRRKRW